MLKKLMILVFVMMITPKFIFSQKAFEAIHYSGTTQNIVVKFTFADGYIAGCEIKTKDIKTKKTSKFLPENGYPNDDKKMKFYHFSTSGKKFSDYFIIDGMEEFEEGTPAKFTGTYYFNGKAFNITLTKLSGN
jgi:hypothetical protein